MGKKKRKKNKLTICGIKRASVRQTPVALEKFKNINEENEEEGDNAWNVNNENQKTVENDNASLLGIIVGKKKKSLSVGKKETKTRVTRLLGLEIAIEFDQNSDKNTERVKEKEQRRRRGGRSTTSSSNSMKTTRTTPHIPDADNKGNTEDKIISISTGGNKSDSKKNHNKKI